MVDRGAQIPKTILDVWCKVKQSVVVPARHVVVRSAQTTPPAFWKHLLELIVEKTVSLLVPQAQTEFCSVRPLKLNIREDCKQTEAPPSVSERISDRIVEQVKLVDVQVHQVEDKMAEMILPVPRECTCPRASGTAEEEIVKVAKDLRLKQNYGELVNKPQTSPFHNQWNIQGV